jgi:hypothetical protein
MIKGNHPNPFIETTDTNYQVLFFSRFSPTALLAQEQVMKRSIKAIANRTVFANRKDRVVIRKAKTNDHATLHAHAVHALYSLYGSLRGLLYAATAWQTDGSTQPWCSWMSGMQPCLAVRQRSPEVVVVA